MPESSIFKKLFGGEVEIALEGIEEPLAQDMLESAYEIGVKLERIFNFYDPSSELSRLNSERTLNVSPPLLEVITTALHFCELTKGEYDISLGKAILERKKNGKDMKLPCSYKDIKIDKNRVELTHEDVLVDLGSIAKGAIADKMAEYLKSQGVISGLIDARGDLAIFGEEERIVDIEHPRNWRLKLKSIRLKNGCVATSGDYRQYIVDFDHSHIINKKDLICVTVIAPSLMVADVYASVLFVSHEREAIMHMPEAADVKAMTVDKDMKIRYYNGFEEALSV